MTSASVPVPGQPRPGPEEPAALKRVISRNMLLLFVVGVRRRLPRQVRRPADVLVAFAFMLLVAAINYRGIGESVRINIGLTLIEVSGLVLVAIIALGAPLAGDAEPSRAVDFTQDEAVPLAILGGAGLAFSALIGFEDSVNVAEGWRSCRSGRSP